MTELDFRGGILPPKNGPKIGFFKFYWKIRLLILSEFGLKIKFILTAVFMPKSHTKEKSGF